MEHMIDITGADLVKLAQAAYELSVPQGLGKLHARPGPLSQEDAELEVARTTDHGRLALSLDYVHGRNVKMSVFKDADGKLWIPSRWFDHSADDLRILLFAIGKQDKVTEIRAS